MSDSDDEHQLLFGEKEADAAEGKSSSNNKKKQSQNDDDDDVPFGQRLQPKEKKEEDKKKQKTQQPEKKNKKTKKEEAAKKKKKVESSSDDDDASSDDSEDKDRDAAASVSNNGDDDEEEEQEAEKNKKGKGNKNDNNKNDEEKEKITLPFTTNDGQMEVLTYNENKSFVIRGTKINPAATRHHKTELKEYGAKFNGALKDKSTQESFAGWIFPMKKLAEIGSKLKKLKSPAAAEKKAAAAAADGAEKKKYGDVLTDGQYGDKLELIRYSEKSVVVRGTATKEHKEELGKIGKFSPNFTDPTTSKKFAGYVVPFSKLEAAKALLQKLSGKRREREE